MRVVSQGTGSPRVTKGNGRPNELTGRQSVQATRALRARADSGLRLSEPIYFDGLEIHGVGAAAVGKSLPNTRLPRRYC